MFGPNFSGFGQRGFISFMIDETTYYKDQIRIVLKRTKLFTNKYPKIILFILVTILSIYLFNNELFSEFVSTLDQFVFLGEFIGGILSGSLALLSDSAHNLSDTLAIALSYFAHTVGKKPKNTKKTYGYKRAEVLAAFVNASFLVGISIWLLFEAYNRFRKPETIDSKLMLIVAIIGLLANLFSMILLHRDSHISMNIRSSYLHLLGDTISSVGVIAGGIGIYFWNITWIDPVITVLISIYILIQTRHILVNSINILMQASAPLDYEAIKRYRKPTQY